ncbi:MAG: glycerol-3-phosphate acyltransferase [Candidatus Dormiibacterota bacterium]
MPVAVMVSRRHGFDPRAVGERNPGATNVWRLAGARAGMIVLALDMAKGAIAAVVGFAIGGWWAAAAASVGAMAGHAWPVWSRFRFGGRAVATLIGAGSILAPLPALVGWIVFVLLVLPVGLRRAVAVGILMFPLAFEVLEPDRLKLVPVGFAYLVVAIRSRSALAAASLQRPSARQ